MPRARALMIQGTGSNVGKSLMVAGLCRAFCQRGLAVRPFKPQNMSNNAAVTADGGEIGRAQALQARACGVAPSVHMNPILLKPQSLIGAQVIVQGRMRGNVAARDYQAMKPGLLPDVLGSFAHLSREADLVLVEGAGSPAEVNLRANDIANMGFARAANVPVVLVGDIDRGGVIAQIVGTKAVLDPADAAMIQGFIVNKFRGDASLFADGMRLIEERTGWPSYGLVPHCEAASRLPAEDSLDRAPFRPLGGGTISIAVPVLPGLSNVDDLDPLRLDPQVSVTLVEPGQPLPVDADLIILAGSKTTIRDLEAFRREGWDIDLAAHVRRGGRVLGLCGGYQMLGRRIADPDGIEGPPQEIDGLGLLDVTTVMTGEKHLSPVAGRTMRGALFTGYEMHIGRTTGNDCVRPLLVFNNGCPDGSVSPDGRVAGCYVHGLFAEDAQRGDWLTLLGGEASSYGYEASIESALDEVAAHLAAHIDLDRLLTVAR